LKSDKAKSLELVRQCYLALEEKKAGNVRVIDVSALSSITDYLVIATATSEPHVRALRVEMEKVLDAAKTHIVGVETATESGWAVMDAFDVMIHIFTPQTRTRYRLENLWKDGDDVPMGIVPEEKKLPAMGKRKPAKKTSAKKVAPKKSAAKKARVSKTRK
jgi:ribosome-associated protein